MPKEAFLYNLLSHISPHAIFCEIFETRYLGRKFSDRFGFFQKVVGIDIRTV